MKLRQQILTVAEAFKAASGRSETFVSRSALGRASALRSLRDGRDMHSGNIEDGLQWLSDHWPEGAEWPRDVMRPAPTPSDGDPSPEPGEAG